MPFIGVFQFFSVVLLVFKGFAQISISSVKIYIYITILLFEELQAVFICLDGFVVVDLDIDKPHYHISICSSYIVFSLLSMFKHLLRLMQSCLRPVGEIQRFTPYSPDTVIMCPLFITLHPGHLDRGLSNQNTVLLEIV